MITRLPFPTDSSVNAHEKGAVSERLRADPHRIPAYCGFSARQSAGSRM